MNGLSSGLYFFTHHNISNDLINTNGTNQRDLFWFLALIFLNGLCMHILEYMLETISKQSYFCPKENTYKPVYSFMSHASATNI